MLAGSCRKKQPHMNITRSSELLLRVCTKLLKIRRKIRNRTMTFVARAVTVP
jgi:hypothetical protein